ncbi:hypothetical protein ACH3O9_18890 [Leeuwenhoekiella sp. A16]|uniref:hypothetical protein n=1 Tax=unclassified Leeuwenhoekiella TaxID=2615029 RepID=UPI003A7FFDFF
MANFFKFIAIIIGICSVTVSIIYGNSETVFVKPFFHVFLYLYYWRKTGDLNVMLLSALVFAMLGEACVALGMTRLFYPAMFLFTLYFISFTFLLRPVLRKTNFSIRSRDLTAPFIGFIAITYIIITISSLVVDHIPSIYIYTPAFLSFVLFITVCFYVSIFNRHPKSVFLFIAGAGYTVVALGTFIFEYLEDSTALMGVINGCEFIAQLLFVQYLINMKKVIRESDSYF